MTGKSSMPFVHDTSAPTWVAVIPRRAVSPEEITWLQCEGRFCFHFANGWEENGEIKVVGCCTPHFSFDYAERESLSLYEWVLQLSTGTITERVLYDIDVDFPVINPTKLASP